MKTLIEDYERRLKTTLEELRVCEINVEKEARLQTKASCYRTFIAELRRELSKLAKIKEQPVKIEIDEWLYKGCFIQKSEHPKLIGKYEVFKNNDMQTHVNRCLTFKQAKKICEDNECFDNTLTF